MVHKRKSGSQIPSKINLADEVLTEPLDILNSLNTHFATVGKNLSSYKVDYSEISKTIQHSQLNSFVWVNTTASEISSIISSLNSKKASGSDEVSIVLLKKLNSLISPILSILFNQSFQAGVYPDYLKIAQVIPLHKGGDKTLQGNYRPISLLSNVNKIFEKVLYSRLYPFLEKSSIINSNQFGFRQGFSTSMAISHFYENILCSYDNNKATCAVLLDLAKAFDSVDRDIVLFKLHKYGIRGNMWKLLKSYLSNRKQFVTDKSLNSSLVDVDVGVPQGSVLGPLLFILHVNDMKFSTKMNIINFADDTLLYMNFDNVNDMESIINKELECVFCWLRNNNLRLNVSKTKYMLFLPKSTAWKNLNLKITIDQAAELAQVEQYKYLGVIIDSKLNWTHHIDYLTKKLSRTLGILLKTRYYLDTKSLLLILQSLFLSHINYGILCWGRCSKTAIERLSVLLNKAFRFIYFCGHTDSVVKYYVKNKILQVKDIFNLELGKFMFKFHRRLLPINFDNYFVRPTTVHTHNTRFSESNFSIPRKNKSVGKNTLGFLGAQLWSTIPDSLKNSLTVNSFVNNYKSYLLQQYTIK